MSAHVGAAVALAILTAFLYALSNVLELIEAEQVPDEYALKLGLMARLIRRPRWLLGVACDVVGYLTQAAALALAAVVFVMPIVASGIVMALFLGAALTHRSVRPSDWLAATVLSAGLAAFLYEVSPTGGRPSRRPRVGSLPDPQSRSGSASASPAPAGFVVRLEARCSGPRPASRSAPPRC